MIDDETCRQAVTSRNFCTKGFILLHYMELLSSKTQTTPRFRSSAHWTGKWLLPSRHPWAHEGTAPALQEKEGHKAANKQETCFKSEWQEKFK